MLKQIPIQVWILVAIAAAAYRPARYVFRYFSYSPSRRDITKPAEDLDWRTPGKLSFNVVVLGAMAALAVFIFTPTAAQFAQAPIFLPILMLVVGAWALLTVLRGFTAGRVQPMARGFYNTYERRTQPKRYWASMGWNAVLGCFLFWISATEIVQAPAQALEDRCYDWKISHPAREELSACNKLISDSSKSYDDLSGIINARGNAYYRLGDYRRAEADYTKAMQLDPKSSASHFNMGLVDEQLGNRKRAVADYAAAIALKTDNADAYLNRGLIYLDIGKFDQAVSDLSRVLQFRPNDATALANRGLAYAWEHDRSSAEQDFAAVRKVDPSNLVLAHGEALLSMNAGNFTAAVDQLSVILKAYPTDTFSLGLRATAYRQLGEDDKMQADIAAMKRASTR